MRQRIREIKQQGHDEGFTLIELLIVIVILGILAGIVVFAVSGINDRGQASADKTTCKTIQTANEAYFAKNNAYATTTGALSTAGFLASDPAGYTITVAGTPPKATTAGPGC